MSKDIKPAKKTYTAETALIGGFMIGVGLGLVINNLLAGMLIGAGLGMVASVMTGGRFGSN